MKKYLLSAGVVAAFVYYALRQNNEANRVVAPPLPSGQPETTSASPAPSGRWSKYKDGEYLGPVSDAYYGNVQVQAVVRGGRLFDVQFLDYPHDHATSVEINSQAIPYLKSEAISAQSGDVEIVSGATQTSLAFIQSLKAALAPATL